MKELFYRNCIIEVYSDRIKVFDGCYDLGKLLCITDTLDDAIVFIDVHLGGGFYDENTNNIS